MTSVEAMQVVMNNREVGARPVLAPWILIYDGFGWGKKYSTLKISGRTFGETIRGASVWPKEICAEWEIVEIGDILVKESCSAKKKGVRKNK